MSIDNFLNIESQFEFRYNKPKGNCISTGDLYRNQTDDSLCT